MDRQDIIARLRENEAARRARGVSHAALFGSRARGEDGPDSDIDIMIEIEPPAPVSLWAYVGLKDFIAGMFTGPVDVVAGKNSNPMSARPPWPPPSMLSKSAHAALHDLLHHIDPATRLIEGFDEMAFREDVRTVYAVTRCLEIISEASRRLSDEMKARHTPIAWRQMAGAGNISRHDYEGAAARFVWDGVKLDLPASSRRTLWPLGREEERGVTRRLPTPTPGQFLPPAPPSAGRYRSRSAVRPHPEVAEWRIGCRAGWGA